MGGGSDTDSLDLDRMKQVKKIHYRFFDLLTKQKLFIFQVNFASCGFLQQIKRYVMCHEC